MKGFGIAVFGFWIKKGRSKATNIIIQFAIFNLQFRLVGIGKNYINAYPSAAILVYAGI